MRTWSARATPEGADSYRRHFESEVLPRLSAIPGQRGALLLFREDGDDVELIVLTFWESIDAVRAFAGNNPATAVVAPRARAALKRFDPEVEHFDVILDTRIPPG